MDSARACAANIFSVSLDSSSIGDEVDLVLAFGEDDGERGGDGDGEGPFGETEGLGDGLADGAGLTTNLISSDTLALSLSRVIFI